MPTTRRKKAKEAAAQSRILRKNPKRESKKESKKVSRNKVALDAKARHDKKIERRKISHRLMHSEDWNLPPPAGLNGKLELPKISSKYATYFEFADNHEKKKKLEYSTTNQHDPPPGFTFVPIGNPTITDMCKEISREKDAMIFIVSDRVEEESHRISEQTHRVGYHFRETIVDEVRTRVGDTAMSNALVPPGYVEPIPKKQKDIDDQADKALRDLFPRIPHTDRRMIIDHAFKLGGTFQGEPTVGLQANIPLSRRVQLATLAHIRHTHTRYDKLLRETSWANARKVVEPICLSVLLKWRGDEETGRDQLEEILREVVIITDSDTEDSSEDSSDSEESGESDSGVSASDNGSDEPIIIVDSPRQRSKPPMSTIGPGALSHGAIPEQATRQRAVRQLQGNEPIRPNSVGYQHDHDFDASMSKRSLRKQEKLEKRGFTRYRTALVDAMERRDKSVEPGGHNRTVSGFMGTDGDVRHAPQEDKKGKANYYATDDRLQHTTQTSGQPSGASHVFKDYLVPSIEAPLEEDGEYKSRSSEHIISPYPTAQHRQVVRGENTHPRVPGTTLSLQHPMYEPSGAQLARSELYDMRPREVMSPAKVVRNHGSSYRSVDDLPVYDMPRHTVPSQSALNSGLVEIGRRAPHEDRVLHAQSGVSYVLSTRAEMPYQVPQPISRPIRQSEYRSEVRSHQAPILRRRSRSPSAAVRTQVPVSRSAAVDPYFLRTFSQAQLNDPLQHDSGIVVIREHGRTPYRSREEDEMYHRHQEPRRVVYQQPLPPDVRVDMDRLPQYGGQSSRPPPASGQGQIIYTRAPPTFIELD